MGQPLFYDRSWDRKENQDAPTPNWRGGSREPVYDAMETDIKRMTEAIGRRYNPEERVHQSEHAAIRNDIGIDARMRRYDSLRRAFEKRGLDPGPRRDYYGEMTGDGGAWSEMSDKATGADYIARRPAGVVKSRKGRVEVQGSQSPAAASTKAEPSQLGLGKIEPEGLLSEGDRAELRQRVRNRIMQGDQSREKERWIWRQISGMGRAWTANQDTPSGRRAYSDIDEAWKRNEPEFTRDERIRQGNIANDVGYLEADMRYGTAKDAYGQKTVTNNGKPIDPEIVKRHPELYIDADLNELRRSGLPEEDINVIRQLAIRNYGNQLSSASLAQNKSVAEIEKLRAQAQNLSAEANFKYGRSPEDLAIVKQQIWQEFQTKVADMAKQEDDRWDTVFEPDPGPEYISKLGMEGRLPPGAPVSQAQWGGGYVVDDNLLTALARRRMQEMQDAEGMERSQLIQKILSDQRG